MARITTPHTTEWIGRVLHRLFPSRQHLVLALAVEGVAHLLGLPLAVDIATGVLADLAARWLPLKVPRRVSRAGVATAVRRG